MTYWDPALEQAYLDDIRQAELDQRIEDSKVAAVQSRPGSGLGRSDRIALGLGQRLRPAQPILETAASAVLFFTPGGAVGRGMNLVKIGRGPVGRVFWSGGKVAQEAAEQWARSTGSTTLEMTATGQELAQVTKGMDWLTEARPLWSAASRDFARGASGTVHVFHNARGVSLESVWRLVEYPELISNPNVRIIYHVVWP